MLRLAQEDVAAVLCALVVGVEFLVEGRGRHIVVMAVPIVQEEEEILPGMLLEPLRGQVRDHGARDHLVEQSGRTRAAVFYAATGARCRTSGGP